MPNLLFDLQQMCSVKKGAFKNRANFTEKHLCWNLLLSKLQALKALQLYQKMLQHRCFTMKFAKLLRTLFCRTFGNNCFWFLQAFNAWYNYFSMVGHAVRLRSMLVILVSSQSIKFPKQIINMSKF